MRAEFHPGGVGRGIDGEEILRLFAPSPDAERDAALLREQLRASLASHRAAGTLHRRSCGHAEACRDSALASAPWSTSRYVEELLEHVVPGASDLASPLCMGHMSGVVPHFTRFIAELVVTLNQNLLKCDASRSLTHVERQVLGTLHRLVFGNAEEFYRHHIQDPESTLGVITSGGSIGNLTALWVARNRALPATADFPGVEVAGMAAALRHHDCDDAVILVSRLRHYSIDKAAGMLGLGSRGVVGIAVDRGNRIDARALRSAVAACRKRRARVLAIVGLAGSTECGSIDPLAEVGEVAREAGIHFHVDAAWGGPMLFSPTHRERLAGVELADSVVIDGHKQMYLPIGTGTLLFRDPLAARVIAKTSDYVIQHGSGDLGCRSIEGSRDGSVLFLDAALHLIGARGYAMLVDRNLRKAQVMARLIARRPEFELMMLPETNIVLYRYLPASLRSDARRPRELDTGQRAHLDEMNERLQRTQAEAGHTFVSRTTIQTTVDGVTTPAVVLRAVIANPLVEEHHMHSVLRDQARIGAALEAAWDGTPAAVGVGDGSP